jgi:hypothetical protein
VSEEEAQIERRRFVGGGLGGLVTSPWYGTLLARYTNCVAP